jgi:hypothetical protein
MAGQLRGLAPAQAPSPRHTTNRAPNPLSHPHSRTCKGLPEHSLAPRHRQPQALVGHGAQTGNPVGCRCEALLLQGASKRRGGQGGVGWCQGWGRSGCCKTLVTSSSFWGGGRRRAGGRHKHCSWGKTQFSSEADAGPHATAVQLGRATPPLPNKGTLAGLWPVWGAVQAAHQRPAELAAPRRRPDGALHLGQRQATGLLQLPQHIRCGCRGCAAARIAVAVGIRRPGGALQLGLQGLRNLVGRAEQQTAGAVSIPSPRAA